MAADIKDLLEQALALPKDARATLARELLDTLEPDFEPSVEQAWRDELDRRLARMERGEGRSVSWEEARRVLHGESQKPVK